MGVKFAPRAVTVVGRAVDQVITRRRGGCRDMGQRRPCRRHPETRERCPKARRQNGLSLILTRMIRSGKGYAALYKAAGQSPIAPPREHYAFIADCIHR